MNAKPLSLAAVIVVLLSFDLEANLHGNAWRSGGAVVQRVQLESNTPSLIYKELADPILVYELAGDLKRLGPAVIFGGNDDGFEFAVLYLKKPDSSDETFVKRVKAYARLRWWGLRGPTALRMISKLPDGKIASAGGSEEAVLLRYWPEIPLEEWKKPKTELKASFPWLNPSEFFVIEDDDISLIRKAGTPSVIYIIDSQELKEENLRTFEIAAAEATKQIGEKWKAMEYWQKLKKLLSDEGILWRSPNELNSQAVWE